MLISWFPSLFLLLFLLILSMLLLKNKKKSGRMGFKLPPSPPKLPIIGNLHQIGNLPHQSLQNLSKEHGPILLLQLGSIETLVVSSADAAKDVLKTHDLDCCSRSPSPGPKWLSYNCLDITFSPYGDYWKEMKALFISELVSMKRVKSFAYAREAEIDKLINTLTQNSHTPVNLNEKLYGLAGGIIGTVAFGKIYGTNQFKSEEFYYVLSEAMEMLAGFAAEDFFPSVGRLVDVLTGLKARRQKSFRRLDAFLESVVEQHLDPTRPESEHENLVDVLIRLLKKQSASFSFTKDHVKAILLDAFLGGINTSSVTMLWAMSELIKNPRAMKKVQIEIRSSVGKKGKVEAEDVAKLKYLKMVVKETFRLHPPIPLLIPHETVRQCRIAGFDVFPKTRIFVNVWAIGRDPNSWENPNEFYPERFEDNDIDFKGSNYELLPFGAGRRICPGLAMGTTNVEYALANLLYWFDWELPGGMRKEDFSMEEEGGLVCQRKTPLCLVPVSHCLQD
ncbi:hypothetical protein SLE2022_256340 [Rubroshorea leprosula]